MQLTMLTRRWLAVVSSVSTAACLLVFSLCPASADPVQNRRILDIQSKNLGDKCRIVIFMDTATRPLVTPPMGGEPLRIELGRSELDPSVRLDQLTGPLLRKVSAVPSDSGLVTINLELTTSQVDVTDFLLEQEALVIVDIKPRRAVALPDGTPVAAQPTSATPLADATLPVSPAGADEILPAPVPADAAMEPEPSPAAGEPSAPAAEPVVAPSPAAASLAETTAAPAAGPTPVLPTLALPVPPNAPPAVPQAEVPLNLPVASQARVTSGSPVDSLTQADAFPERLLAMDFPGVQQMLAAYQAQKYPEAIKTGQAALRVSQSPESLDSLLYLLAECRFQQTRVYDASASAKRPPGWDWPEAQNHYEQARRFAPASSLRPFADFRLSQIYGQQGNLANRQAALWDILHRHELPNFPQVLMDYGDSSLGLHAASPATTSTLGQAVAAFKAYRDEFPEDERHADAQFLLGEAYYQLGNDREAYANMREGMLGRTPEPTEIHAHWGLTAHRIGVADISVPCRPLNEVLHPIKAPDEAKRELTGQYNELFGAFVRNSQDPAVHLELAGILDRAGNRREAMREYQQVVRGLAIPGKPGQVLQARRALAAYALQDRRAGKLDPEIPYDDYSDPGKSLAEMYDNCFDLKTRAGLLGDRANQLLAEGRNGEAVGLLLPHLEPGRMPQQYAAELCQTLREPLREVMDGLYRSGEHLPAMRLYKAFENQLADHPQRNDVLLDCARILMQNDMRGKAGQALDRMSAYETLTPEQKVAATLLRRELLLDPAHPEALKRDGASLLKSDLDDAVRARILHLMARVYGAEEQHSYAAQLDREGAAMKGLGLADRVGFFFEAARQYEAGKVNSKAIETYYQAIYALEEAGVAPVEAHDWYGTALVGMAQNFQNLGDYDRTAQACTQYLKYYPDGAQADLARYTLGQSYEQRAGAGVPGAGTRSLRAKALEQYETLAKADASATSRTFWQNVGQKSADQLRWEQDHPYLMKEEGLP